MRIWNAWLRGSWQPCFLTIIKLGGQRGCASVYACTNEMVFLEVSRVVRYFNAYSIEITIGPLRVLPEKMKSYLHKRTCIWFWKWYNWYQCWHHVVLSHGKRDYVVCHILYVLTSIPKGEIVGIMLLLMSTNMAWQPVWEIAEQCCH